LDDQNTSNQQPDGEQQQQGEPKPIVDTVSRDELKEVIRQRDEVKRKLREIEEADAKKRGDFEALLNQTRAELDERNKALEEASAYKDKYVALETQRKNELLAQLSEEHKKIAEMLPIDALPEYVRLNSKQTAPTSSQLRSGKGSISSSTTYEEFQQLDNEGKKEFHRINPIKFTEYTKISLRR